MKRRFLEHTRIAQENDAITEKTRNCPKKKRKLTPLVENVPEKPAYTAEVDMLPMPIVIAEMNGENYRLLLDTGSTTSLLPTKMFPEGTTYNPVRYKITGVSGNTITPIGVKNCTFNLIDQKRNKIIPHDVNSASVFKNLPIKGADGILGMDFILDHQLTLDMGNQRILKNGKHVCQLEQMEIPNKDLQTLPTQLVYESEAELLEDEENIWAQVIGDESAKTIDSLQSKVITFQVPDCMKGLELIIDTQELAEQVGIMGAIVKVDEDCQIMISVGNFTQRPVTIARWQTLNVQRMTEDQKCYAVYTIQNETEFRKRLNMDPLVKATMQKETSSTVNSEQSASSQQSKALPKKPAETSTRLKRKYVASEDEYDRNPIQITIDIMKAEGLSPIEILQTIRPELTMTDQEFAEVVPNIQKRDKRKRRKIAKKFGKNSGEFQTELQSGKEQAAEQLLHQVYEHSAQYVHQSFAMKVTEFPQPELMTEEQPPSDERFEECLNKELPQTAFSEEGKRIFKNTARHYRDVLAFKDEPLGCSAVFQQDIPLITDKVVRIPQFPLSHATHAPMKAWVEEMLQYVIIRPSRSPYNSPCMMVPKPRSLEIAR